MTGPLRDERLAALYDLLDELPALTGSSQGGWLARLVAVLRPGDPRDVDTASRSLREFAALLRARPDDAARLRAHLAAVLAGRVHRLLYADLGATAAQGFFGDLTGRMLSKLLPPAVDTAFLMDVFAEVFDRPTDARWLTAIPAADWDLLFRALDLEGRELAPARARCRDELGAAIALVSHRIAALGSDPTLVRYLPALAQHESPFLAQVGEIAALVARHASAGGTRGAEDRHCEVLVGQCEAYLDLVRRRSREAGVCVGLVFLVSRLEQSLRRLVRLLDLYVPPAPRDAPGLRDDTRGFLLELIDQASRRTSLSHLFHANAELIARRVTERASKSGEHYVTETHAGLVAMFRAAAGAGFVIGVMALIKIFIAGWGLPPLWAAVAYSLNYGLGFVLIHVLHLTIATKQPAMTAATLASALDSVHGRQARVEALTDLAARVSRTQWVSIAGNVTVGFLTALAIALTTTRLLGWQMVPDEKAAHLLHDLDPLRSLALLHAAIAGVYLFLSGLVSGWYDNKALYHRVPERLQRVRWLERVLGPARLARLAGYVEKNLGALAGNFAFGWMLGCTPLLGWLVGLPLDIRHVAFASANLAYGLNGLDFDLPWRRILLLAAGVLAVGFVNLAVSFTLALRTALRSRGIPPEQMEGLLWALGRRFLERPRDFFWPRTPASTGLEASRAA